MTKLQNGTVKNWRPSLYFLTILAPVVLGITPAFAGESQASDLGIISGVDLQSQSIEGALRDVQPGDIVILGEMHGTQVQAEQQLQVLRQLRAQGLRVSVGMEFFSFTDQVSVDHWRSGLLTESEFLTTIQWGTGFPFETYRAQCLFPQDGEFLRAINAPRRITRKIARDGLASLTDAERSLLPPGLTRGNQRYFERFKEAIGHLPDPSAAENYFMAQSTWDDTMAWQSAEFLNLHPEQVLVIIVGNFHVQYGGGLPERLRARGVGRIHSFSLVNVSGLSPEEFQTMVRPHPIDGILADWIWLSDF